MTAVLQNLNERTVFEQEFGDFNSNKIVINNPQTSLLFKVKKNDKSSIKECVDKYGKVIWGISRIFAHSTDEAEKLTTQIFSELWKNLESFDCEKIDDKKFIMMIALKCVNKNRTKIM